MKNLSKLKKNLLYRIGSEVANIAKTKTAPIITGNLKRDIKARNVTDSSVEVGNTLKASYAKFVHSGTGLYGIKKAKITPKKAKALRTPYGYKKSTKGMRANPYLNNAADIYIKNGGLDRAVKDFSKELKDEIVKDIKVEFKKIQ